MPERVTAELCSWAERSISASPSPWTAPITIVESTRSPIASSVISATGSAHFRSLASTSCLPASTSIVSVTLAALAEVELRQRALDHLGGHLLSHLEAAGARGA